MNRRIFVFFALLCLTATGLFAQSVNVQSMAASPTRQAAHYRA